MPTRLPPGILRGEDDLARCFWCSSDPLYRAYHDTEWGFPQRDDTRLFEKLCLEGFQAGLSWLTILRKRENFRRAFRGFEIEAVARMGARDVARLLRDPGIVRHRGKIESALGNAKRAAALVDEFGSLADYLWRFAPEPDNAGHERIEILDHPQQVILLKRHSLLSLLPPRKRTTVRRIRLRSILRMMRE